MPGGPVDLHYNRSTVYLCVNIWASRNEAKSGVSIRMNGDTFDGGRRRWSRFRDVPLLPGVRRALKRRVTPHVQAQTSVHPSVSQPYSLGLCQGSNKYDYILNRNT